MKPYKVIDLSKILDPATETRRCKIRRFNTGGPIPDFHTDMDLTTHLGTHVETPYHHNDNWKDVVQLPIEHFLGRCVYLNFTHLAPNSYITADDLEKVCRGRVGKNDVVILDSPHKLPPFTPKTNTAEDKRLFISRETAQWLADIGVKCVGFGDGVSIENSNKDVCAFHDVLMEQDVTFLEVLKNLDQLSEEVFFIAFLPLPIKGIDSSPVRVVAIEGLPGFGA
ncbi:arylformamidase [Sphaerochaeta associata]|uniref:Cyclase family protein n=1 Tax=Sphaerochaeta associata TaxID=1129264 RepID=A0ABY4DID9_9SPIR|nr:cyclase family protein [Sphaerochaeta associata]UOM51636.1 cyclase family protein [Sphaerochaeta associata]SMP52557.1 arylformamidase [Sphaerochaeta associata]